MENEKNLIDVADCPCDGCEANPCGHPARCVKFTLWLNKTVDAVKVVRCKDCKSWKEPWLVGQTMGRCMLGKTAITEPDHFCSYGRRMSDHG